MNFIIEYSDELPKSMQDTIHQGHVEDEQKAGIVCNFKEFAFIAKDKMGEMVGVLSAYTAFSELYLNDIWVRPSYRRHALGRALLLELEQRFQNSGFNNINLVTSAFQAPEFYKRCGFELEFTRVNKHNPQLTKYFFVKYFENPSQHQGILT